MTLEELARLVATMRQRQKKYQSTGEGRPYLTAVETRVDAAVKEILSPPRGDLFDAPVHDFPPNPEMPT